MTTLREAAQMALDALEYCVPSGHGPRELYDDAIEALRAALAQPEQEEDYDAIANKQLASLKAAAKVTFEDAAVRAVHKLYNAPPQREWQGLTIEERTDIRRRIQEYTPMDDHKYGEAVQFFTEEALKEKNT